MDHNQAIASIASAAIAQIRQVAIEAIQATSYSDGGDQTEVASYVSDESLAKLAQHVKVNPPSDVRERPRRGRPRLGPTQPAAPEVTTAVTLTPASTQGEEVEIEITDAEVEEATAVEAEAAAEAEADVSPDDFDPEAGHYPPLSDKWFADNIDDARTLCRRIASLRLSALGAVDAKKEIMEITKRPRVTDFNADDCATYYRATTTLMAVE